MKAKDLIKKLQADPEREVLVSLDSEGNEFGRLKTVEKTTYSDDGYGVELDIEDGKKCFVLWP